MATEHRLDSFDAEAQMQEKHLPVWQTLIKRVVEEDLSESRVLDVGCNRGGFLRELYRQRPFASAVGYDPAGAALEIARRASQELPIEYVQADSAAAISETFDIAFSYDVIYLLPDIAAHAASIMAKLRPGGRYYAVTGVFTDNVLFARWRPYLEERFNTSIPERSANDYLVAFQDAGFLVSVRRLGHSDYSFIDTNSPYFRSPFEALQYHGETTLIFRCARP